MKTVEFRGYAFRVPASWPVYQLNKDPSQCVRYDVNAVYLGTPGSDQHCPPGLVGTADTVSVGGPAIPGVLIVSAKTGRRAQVGDLRSASDLSAAPGTIMENPGQHEFAMAMPNSGPRVTATYGTDPGLIMQVFGSLRPVGSPLGQPGGSLQPRGVPQSQRPWITPHPTPDAWTLPSVLPTHPADWPTASDTSGWDPPPASYSPRPTPRPSYPPQPQPTVTTSPDQTTPSPTGTAAPAVSATPTPSAAGFGTPVPGFDTCTAPSLATMKAWRANYSVANIYIGGQEMACDYGNLSASWIQAVEGMGWSLMPTFVGLQAPCDTYSAEIDPPEAAAEGSAAATGDLGREAVRPGPGVAHLLRHGRLRPHERRLRDRRAHLPRRLDPAA